MFACFNRPKNKNARPDNSLIKPAFETVTEINNRIKKTLANAGTKNEVYFQQKARVNANMRLFFVV